MRVVNSALLQSSCPSIFMKLSSVFVCWPCLRAVTACACRTSAKLPSSPEVLWGLCGDGGWKGRASASWCFHIHCAEEINGIARGLLIPFKRRNILSPKRMWKKLEQLHLYHEPLYQREQGRGVGKAAEGTGYGLPFLCSRLNSCAWNWDRRKWWSVFFLIIFSHKCRDRQGLFSSILMT